VRTADFDYHLPPDLIAQHAVEPRDSSRLLDCRDLSDHVFSDLPELVEPGDLLIVNRTRVRRARLRGVRTDTGGSVELLLLDGTGHRWTALARPSRRLRPGVTVVAGTIEAIVTTDPQDGVVELELATSMDSVEAAIEAEGDIPLPPYFVGQLADDERYQTIFATQTTSAAAPTAGLHFTPGLVARLRRRGLLVAHIHLQVGMDTFRPITSKTIGEHVMHSEMIDVGEDAATAVEAARAGGGRVIAVGTTAARALEAAADGGGGVEPMSGPTDLFITPGHRFSVIDGLITNFHVPSSTLVVLVAAFMGERWRVAYQTAVDRRYRMLSFGDAMLAFR
jgi:S-adenosylmethionine:tRNA ribosyltransferase-isomerase